MTNRHRYLYAAYLAAIALAGCLAFALCGQPAAAQEAWTAADTLQALDGQPSPIGCIVAIETGHTYDPYSVGRAGELGVAQLHPQGELPRFLYGDWSPAPAVGFRDPYDPFVAVAFLRWWGDTHRWTFQPWSAWRFC